MLQKIDTVIVGGGQAGLAISYYLAQEDREHVVLERAPAVANTWRNQRWDSFTLVTPNFQVRMPGAEYDGDNPDGFMSLAEVVEYFDNYVARFRLPVHCGVDVFSVEKIGERYVVRTSERNYEADNVVIATGLYQSPKIPTLSEKIPPSILQLHSMEYKNPSTLPEGAVLVVGTVLGLVHNTHATAARLFDDTVARDGLADHWSGILGWDGEQVNEGGHDFCCFIAGASSSPI